LSGEGSQEGTIGGEKDREVTGLRIDDPEKMFLCSKKNLGLFRKKKTLREKSIIKTKGRDLGETEGP